MGSLLVLVAMLCPQTSLWRKPAELCASTLGAALLVGGAASSSALEQRTRSGFFKWQGDISFSLYLWHFPVAAAVQLTPLRSFASGSDLFAIYLVGVAAISSASFRWLECPTRRSFQRVFDAWGAARQRNPLAEAFDAQIEHGRDVERE